MIQSIAIIGAGISGLTTGCALREFGFKVDIFEKSELKKSWKQGSIKIFSRFYQIFLWIQCQTNEFLYKRLGAN